MATYAIGDVQGCFAELQQLLEHINFDENTDKLWFVGDLVNRGPESLKVLRFVKNLGNKAITVLGNHDFHLIALYYDINPLQKQHTLEDIIQAPDSEELIDWLRCQPLLHHDPALGYVMTHAGMYPMWDLAQAKKYAHEIEAILCGDNYLYLLEHMYGDQPDTWNENLTGIERQRFIINAFTRMRFCTPEGKLDFNTNGDLNSAPKGYKAWFNIPNRKTQNEKIIFGHWAALQAKVDVPNIYALDGGCVWGSKLIAMRLEDGERFSVGCGMILT